MQTNVQKWGNSLGLRIPNLYVKELNLKEGNQIEIVKKNNKLVISPVKKKKSLDEMLDKVNNDNIHGLEEFGKPEGKEVW